MIKAWLVVAGLLVTAPAYAKLPAASPEQSQLAEQKKAEEAKRAKEEQEALARVQDRIASRFGKGGSASATTAKTDIGKMPLKAVEGSGVAGPQGGTRQSAEAHSTPAR